MVQSRHGLVLVIMLMLTFNVNFSAGREDEEWISGIAFLWTFQKKEITKPF